MEEFLQGLKEAVEEEFETQAKRIVWEVKAGGRGDGDGLHAAQNVLMELTRNAIYFREGDQAIHFTVWNEGGCRVRGPAAQAKRSKDARTMGTRAADIEPAGRVRPWIILRAADSGYAWRQAGSELRCAVGRIKSPADPALERGGAAGLERMNKIVVIDDERPMLLTLEALLKRHGFAVQTAGTASAGLGMIEKSHPDLVLLDLGLPDAPGLETLGKIKQSAPGGGGDHHYGAGLAEQRHRVDQAGGVPFHLEAIRPGGAAECGAGGRSSSGSW